MVRVIREVQPQPEWDARYRVVNEAIELFEETHEFIVGPAAQSFLHNEILISPQEFSIALQNRRINSEEIKDTIIKALVVAKQLSMERGLKLIDREAASDACHQVIEAEMGCPWPLIIC